MLVLSSADPPSRISTRDIVVPIFTNAFIFRLLKKLIDFGADTGKLCIAFIFALICSQFSPGIGLPQPTYPVFRLRFPPG